MHTHFSHHECLTAPWSFVNSAEIWRTLLRLSYISYISATQKFRRCFFVVCVKFALNHVHCSAALNSFNFNVWVILSANVCVYIVCSIEHLFWQLVFADLWWNTANVVLGSLNSTLPTNIHIENVVLWLRLTTNLWQYPSARARTFVQTRSRLIPIIDLIITHSERTVFHSCQPINGLFINWTR